MKRKLFNSISYAAAVGSLILAAAAMPDKDDGIEIVRMIGQKESVCRETMTNSIATKEEVTITLQGPELIPCYTHNISYITMYEYDLLCRVVMSEAGAEPIECQIAVAETILNRLDSGSFGNTIEEVVYKPYQYSTADNGEPTESVQMAVTNALEVQTYPSDMVYFRTGHYHDFGQAYKKIGKTYFSLEE